MLLSLAAAAAAAASRFIDSQLAIIFMTSSNDILITQKEINSDPR